MICTTPHCGGLVTWVPPGEREKAHYRCQGPCNRPYAKNGIRFERPEVPTLKPKEVKEMTGVERIPVSVNGSGGLRDPEKTCSKCGKSKPATLEYFHKAAQGKYGVNPTCKECLSLNAKKRWAERTSGKDKRTYHRKEKPVVTYPDPPAPVKSDNPGRDAIIAILEKKIAEIQAAIEVIRKAL